MAEKKVANLEKELFSDRERMEIWIAENWKKCLFIAAAAVIAVVAVSAVSHYRQKADDASRAQLASAGIDTLEKVIAENAGHPAVPAARMRLAKMLFAKGDFTKAAAEFKKVAATPGCAAYLRENAMMDSALCVELANDTKAAANAYSAIEADSSVSAAVRSEAGFNAGRLLLKSGDIAGAKAIFTKIAAPAISGQNSNLWAIQSRIALAAIKNGDFAPKANAKAGK